MSAAPGAPVFDGLAPPAIDTSTLHTLMLMLSGALHAAPVDVRLAAELLSLANQHQADLASYAKAQRLSLVGQMCNEMLAEAAMPLEHGHLIERLRFPLVKIALADDAFFASAGHPIRQQIGEAVELASQALATTLPERLQIHAQLSLIGDEVCLRASRTTVDLAQLQPVPDAAVALFLEQLFDEAAVRREALELRTRRIAAQELEAQLLGRPLPAGAQRLLRAGWVPMMAAHLRRGGAESPQWMQGMTQLGMLLDAFEPPAAKRQSSAARTALVQACGAALAEAGMHPTKVSALIDALRCAFDEFLFRHGNAAARARRKPAPASGPRAAAPACSAPAVGTSLARLASGQAASLRDEQLLELIVVPEQWFRVHDAGRARTLWLKVSGRDPQNRSIAFAGFDRAQSLSIGFDGFIEDLIAGRSEAIDPSATMLLSLCELRARYKPSAPPAA
jgi:hypothetical protein